MRLSEAQRQYLFTLRLCVQAQSDETPALLKLGLVALTKGRYGEWVALTDAGRALTERLDPQFSQRAIEREATAIAKLVEDRLPNVDMTSASGARAATPSASKPRARTSSVTQQAGTTAVATLPKDSREGDRPAAPSTAGRQVSHNARRDESTARAPHSPARPASRKAAVGSGQRKPVVDSRDPPAPAAAPYNAVRVRNGNKVTYFPLSAYESLHGEKQRCRTSNKFYRSYPMEASATDDPVLQVPPPRK